MTSPLCPQQVGLLIASFLNALLSAACSVGLLVAIGVTVAHNGSGLMVGCNDTVVPINARSPVSAQCPFDTTRIYVSEQCNVLCFFLFFYVFFLLFMNITEEVVIVNHNWFSSHLLLPLRTPPWPCGSPVLCCRQLRPACQCGASSWDWLSEGLPPVERATSKSRWVSLCGAGGWAPGF